MIREVILANLKKWEENGWTAEAINEGECDQFAREIADTVPGAIAIWDFEQSGETKTEFHYLHCFVRYQGRFYDSETPAGVDDWLNLPTFQRYLQAGDAFRAARYVAATGCR